MAFTGGGNTAREAEETEVSYSPWQQPPDAEDKVFITFKDVNALLVGWVGVGVVWRCERPTVDVTDPLATVVLVGALAAMFALGILKEKKGRE